MTDSKLQGASLSPLWHGLLLKEREETLMKWLCMAASVSYSKVQEGSANTPNTQEWARLAKCYADVANGENWVPQLVVELFIGMRGRTAPRSSPFLFRFAECILPARLTNEQLGDAHEFIYRARCTSWERWLKIASTVFWLFINAARELTSALKGQRRTE